MVKSSKEVNRMLFEASFNGDVERVKKSLDLGANPNIKNEFGLTPLHFSVHKKQVEIMKFLIEHGADPNAKAVGEWTPLHEATFVGNTDALLLLLNNGADVNAITNFSKSPITHMLNN
jgi:ankyrin repeat protein